MERLGKSPEQVEVLSKAEHFDDLLKHLEKEAEQSREPTLDELFQDWLTELDAADKDASLAQDGTDAEIDKENDATKETEVPDIPEELIVKYIEDLKSNSDYPETIEGDDTPWERLTSEETTEKRAEFNANKEKIIKEWEEKNGKEWPQYKEDVYVNGKLIRKAGDRYDAHHIKPLSFGGKNDAGNITPISADKHFDKQGVHSPNSPYGEIVKLAKGAKLA